MATRRSPRSYRFIGAVGTNRLVTRFHPIAYRVTRGHGPIGRLLGMRMVIVHTRGRLSGRAIEVPLFATPDGDRLVLVASNGGRPREPEWASNLRSQPEVSVQSGGRSRAMLARRGRGRGARSGMGAGGRGLPRLRRLCPLVGARARAGVRARAAGLMPPPLGKTPTKKMPNIQVFGLDDSPATRAALRFFRERRIVVHYVDLRKKPIAAGELRRFADRLGAAALLDTESRAYREQGLAYLTTDAAGLTARLARGSPVSSGSRSSAMATT